MDKKTLLAFLLIAVVLILMPYYMKIVAPQDQQTAPSDSIATVPARQARPVSTKADIVAQPIGDVVISPSYENVQEYVEERTVAVETPLYFANISNKNGGSFTSFILKNYKATDSTSVQLVDNFNNNNLLFEAISVDGLLLILSEPWHLDGSKKS
jgi:YidC/Oxa1 family membrane protein insertase